MPLISIIVPVYKVEKYLDRCIKSILAQTLSDFELILVDDGSPDNCPKMCEIWGKKDKRIKVLHKENGGLSSARNYGLNMAKGRYIGFVDSDDWIEADMYECLYNLIMETNADFASVEMMVSCDENEKPKRQMIENKILNREQIYDLFFRVSDYRIHYCVCDKLFKKELIDKVRFWEGMQFEDIYFNFQLISYITKGVYSNQIKYYWFFNRKGITHQEVTKRDLDAISIWRKIVKDSRIECPQYTYCAKMNYERAHMGIIGKSIRFGVSKNYTEWDRDRKYLLLQCRKNYLNLLRWKMQISRKLLLTYICISPSLCQWIYKKAHNYKRKYIK